ncbi:4Fe-4S binding protein [Anaerorhabdus sp.]|uniref:4Fe-4S binding protein n=1 Tax=Anaerorhabdus sp. TaxID=1872524 RepID=UPI002FCB984D
MKRRIIKIDEEKCNGCSACAVACHEGAIGMVNGKAKLLRDDYCDGLGDCLPTCPTGAITFEEREALAYDNAAVQANMQRKEELLPCGCPGSQSRIIEQSHHEKMYNNIKESSELRQWPVQIQLVPIQAPYFDGCKLLVAADCTAYAYASFHQDFIRNHVTLIGCPKLDNVDYTSKLTEILRNNDIQELKIVRMEVPCCGGIENACKQALKNSGKFIPWQVITISTNGEIL